MINDLLFNCNPLVSPPNAFNLPSNFVDLSYDSLAHLICAVAFSTWHSIPENPLLLLKLQYKSFSYKDIFSSFNQLPTAPNSPEYQPTYSAVSSYPATTTVPSLIDTSFKDQVKIISDVVICTKSSTSVVLVASLYVNRLRRLMQHTVPAKGSELRVLIVALILAAKWLEDQTYVNQSWAFVSGLSAKDLGIMEFEYLALLQWDVSVSNQQFCDWISVLLDAFNVVFPTHTMAPLATCCFPPLGLSGTYFPSTNPLLPTTSSLVPVSLPETFQQGPVSSASIYSSTNNSLDLFPKSSSTLPQTLPYATPGQSSSTKRPRTSSRLRACSSVMVHMLAASQAPLLSDPTDFNLSFPVDPILPINNACPLFPSNILDNSLDLNTMFNPYACTSSPMLKAMGLIPPPKKVPSAQDLFSHCQLGLGHSYSWDGSGVVIGGCQYS